MTAKPEVQEPDSAPARGYKITVCRVCGLNAPFECDHMRAQLHDPHMANVYQSIEVVPREVAERLAGALAGMGKLTDVQDVDWTQDHSTVVNESAKTLAWYRAAFPKAEEG